MPRHARIVIPGYLHHITQRGNYRQDVFYDDQDRAIYLRYLNKYAREYGTYIYAYCLMKNHVHLIVKPLREDSLARTFNLAHQRYAYYLHQRLNANGHLWQSRYYSCLLLGSHITTAIRYVEQNPVRAKVVRYPWEYPWSSARAHMGKDYKIIRLQDIEEYIQVESWEEFIMAGEVEADLGALRESTRQGKAVGPIDTVKHLEHKLGRRLRARDQGRPFKDVQNMRN